MGRKLRVLEIMGGIGPTYKSIQDRAGIDNVELVGYIDNENGNAECVKAFNLYFGKNYKKQNLNTIDLDNLLYKVKTVDIANISFPSNAFTDESYILGYKKRKSLYGFDKGNRLSVVQSVIDICKFIRPRCIVLDSTFEQNTKEQKDNFKEFINILHNECGYNLDWDKYNARDFGVAQARPRHCIVGFEANEKLTKQFKFPIGNITNKVVGDILLDDVDDKYIISKKDWENIYTKKNLSKKGVSRFIRPTENNELLNTITANYGGGEKGYSAVVRCNKGSGWRFLTPLEIFRAMGLKDDYYYFLKNYFKDSVLYRLAGNSVIGNYMDAIFEILLNIKEFRVWEQK